MNKKLPPTQDYVTTFTLKSVSKIAGVMSSLMRAGFKPSRSTVRRWLAPVRKFRRV